MERFYGAAKMQFHAASKNWRFTLSPSIFAKMVNLANKRLKYNIVQL